MNNWRCTCLNERIDNGPHFVVGGRQSGKIASLIKEAHETDGVIVCPRPRMVDYIWDTAQAMNYKIRRPITYRELFSHRSDRIMNRYFDEYGMELLDSLYRQLNTMKAYNAKTVIIDEDSVKSLNDILAGLKVTDMDGRELRFKIEILGRNESDD